jgi:nucleoside-diphosphate-sugar epimerase
MGEHVLITGGGFIGFQVCDELTPRREELTRRGVAR